MTPKQLEKAIRKAYKQIEDTSKYFYKHQKEITSNQVFLCSKEEFNIIKQGENKC